MLLLTAALGKPVLGAAGLAGGRPARTVYLLVDNSIASGAVLDGQTDLERSVVLAQATLDGLDGGRGDRAAVLALGGPAEVVVWPPSRDASSMREALRELRPTDSRADLSGALDRVRGDLTGAESSGEVEVGHGIFASSLTNHTTKLLDLMSDVLYNPAFAPEELEKLKTQTLSGIAAGKDDPNTIAGNVRSALRYGKQHPYGLFTTEKTVGAITMDDIKGYYNTYFKPNNAYLIIVGDIDLKTAKSISEKYFAKWVPGEVKNPTYPQPKEPAKTYVALVDRPASVQSVINITYPLDLKPGTQDAIRARVTNQILGVGFSARLNQNLREKHGFTYGAGSQLNPDNLV